MCTEKTIALLLGLKREQKQRICRRKMTEKEKKKIYKDKRWSNKAGTGVREQALRRDHNECQDCRRRVFFPDHPLRGWEAEIHPAEQVHHIIEIEERPDLAYELDNLVSLCLLCHNKRHGRCPKGNFGKKKEKLTEERW